MTKQQPIRVGDKFKVGYRIYEVMRCLPGGKLELFCRAECLHTDRYHREVKQWERVA